MMARAAAGEAAGAHGCIGAGMAAGAMTEAIRRISPGLRHGKINGWEEGGALENMTRLVTILYLLGVI